MTTASEITTDTSVDDAGLSVIVPGTPRDVDYIDSMNAQMRQYVEFDVARKLPDVRDGLKISGRRALWTMWSMGARSASPRVKSARVTGEMCGKYHPHAPDAAYGVIATLKHANLSLVHGYGGWGNVERPPSDARYTECHLDPMGELVLGLLPNGGARTIELSNDAVDLVPSYTGEFTEPVVLPALVPLYVVNGADATATGVRSSVPSHNVREVLDLAHYLVDHTRVNGVKAREFITGPDVTSGCDIYDEFDKNGDSGIESYLETGVGKFRMVAKWHVEDAPGQKRKKNKNRMIIIDALPLGAKPSLVVAGINTLAVQEKIPSDVVAENATGRGQFRIRVQVGTHDPEQIMSVLMYYGGKPMDRGSDSGVRIVSTTSLNYTMTVRSNAVVDRLRTVSIIEALRIWLDHRRECITRRVTHQINLLTTELGKVDARLAVEPIAAEIVSHLTERKARTRSDQVTALTGKFPLTEDQAQMILDMSVSAIISLDRESLLAEQSRITGEIAPLQDSISTPAKINNLLRAEIRDIRKITDTSRRCEIKDGGFVVSRPKVLDKPRNTTPGYLMFSMDHGVIRSVKRLTSNLSMQSDLDRFTEVLPVHSGMTLEGITSAGEHLRGPALGDITDKAVHSSIYFANSIGHDSTLFTCFPVDETEWNHDMVFVTAHGKIKRTSGDTMLKHRRTRASVVVGLGKGDSLAFASPVQQTEAAKRNLVMLTAKGYGMSVPISDLTAKGDRAQAVAGIKIGSDDRLIYAGVLTPTDCVSYWTSNDTVGSVMVNQIPSSGLGTRGKKITASKHELAGAVAGNAIAYAESGDGEPTDFTVTVEPRPDLGDRNIARSVASGISKSRAWVHETPRPD